MTNLSQYNEQFIAKLNEQLVVYTTIGTPITESPMWFQYREVKDNCLYFQSSQNGYMFFNIPLSTEHSEYATFYYKEIYEHFKSLKYSHIQENWQSVYYELRPSEKPVIEPIKEEKKTFEPLPPTDYNKQAIDFLNATQTIFTATYKKHDFYFDGDKQTRDIYSILLKNTSHRYRFNFGQSINNSDYGNTPPRAYDILACLTKYDIGNFGNFCSEFGYDTDSRTAYKTYKAVLKEWKNIERIFTANQLELLQDIN